MVMSALGLAQAGCRSTWESSSKTASGGASIVIEEWNIGASLRPSSVRIPANHPSDERGRGYPTGGSAGAGRLAIPRGLGTRYPTDTHVYVHHVRDRHGAARPHTEP